MLKGWECTKCNNVYAPHVNECNNCNTHIKKHKCVFTPETQQKYGTIGCEYSYVRQCIICGDNSREFSRHDSWFNDKYT